MIVARDLVKTYSLGKRSVSVLRGVSLEIRRGEFVVLKGASGAGKSTLLHLIGGLDLPDSGQIECDGCELTKLRGGALERYRNRAIGFVFQAYHLLPELDALENVCLPARMARRSEREFRDRAAFLLEKVGLGDRMDHRPYELSGGEQQRVAIARALVNDPKLLLADEPTGNLDANTGLEILNLICALSEEMGATLLIATHDEKLALRAPRCIVLADGQVQEDVVRA